MTNEALHLRARDAAAALCGYTGEHFIVLGVQPLGKSNTVTAEETCANCLSQLAAGRDVNGAAVVAFVVNLNIPLQPDFLESVLCTAVESAIGYWAVVSACTFAEGGEGGYVSAFVEEQDPSGDEPKSARIDYTAIVKGIQLALNADTKLSSEIRGYIFNAVCERDAGHIDAIAADVIVQLALFGEIVYG